MIGKPETGASGQDDGGRVCAHPLRARRLALESALRIVRSAIGGMRGADLTHTETVALAEEYVRLHEARRTAENWFDEPTGYHHARLGHPPYPAGGPAYQKGYADGKAAAQKECSDGISC